VDEIPRPDVILVFRTTTHATVAAVPQTTLFPRLSRDLEAFPTPQTVDPLEVHTPPLLSKFRRDEPISVTRISPHQLVQPRHQLLLFLAVLLPRSVPLAAPRHPQGLTSPTLRHAPFLLDVLDRLSTPRRAQ
jgi:hypothetical protein